MTVLEYLKWAAAAVGVLALYLLLLPGPLPVRQHVDLFDEPRNDDYEGGPL